MKIFGVHFGNSTHDNSISDKISHNLKKKKKKKKNRKLNPFIKTLGYMSMHNLTKRKLKKRYQISSGTKKMTSQTPRTSLRLDV